jgi:hypothetical protein
MKMNFGLALAVAIGACLGVIIAAMLIKREVAAAVTGQPVVAGATRVLGSLGL